MFHADGSLAEGPIALAEVQGYVYAAKQLAARCARWLGDDTWACALDVEAARLRMQFDAAFWCESLGTYAMALDGQKKACLVRTLNAGQVLFSGIANPERAAAVAKCLMEPRFFSVGASALWRETNGATTRCRITMVRSGPMTMR